jgi:hypothetical protein
VVALALVWVLASPLNGEFTVIAVHGTTVISTRAGSGGVRGRTYLTPGPAITEALRWTTDAERLGQELIVEPKTIPLSDAELEEFEDFRSAELVILAPHLHKFLIRQTWPPETSRPLGSMDFEVETWTLPEGLMGSVMWETIPKKLFTDD